MAYKYADARSMAFTQLKAETHNYGVLTELNTNPRTTYLARLTNPNPKITGIGGGPKDTSAEKRTAHDAARG